MDRKEAVFILVTNLKGSREKREPLTKIAEAVETLLKDRQYDGDVTKLAAEYKVTPQVINEFRKVSKQPPEIKKMIRERKLGLDGSTKLSSIPDLDRRTELARVVEGMSQYDVRSIIDYAKKHTKVSAKEAKRIVLESKTITRDVHAIVIPLDDEDFREFAKFAQSRKIRLEDAAKLAIRELLAREREQKG